MKRHAPFHFVQSIPINSSAFHSMLIPGCRHFFHAPRAPDPGRSFSRLSKEICVLTCWVAGDQAPVHNCQRSFPAALHWPRAQSPDSWSDATGPSIFGCQFFCVLFAFCCPMHPLMPMGRPLAEGTSLQKLCSPGLQSHLARP